MPHAVDIHVGRRLRQARWMNSLTQVELAERVGVRFQQLQKYETGANRVSASRMWELATVLELPIAYFFEGLEGAEADAAEPRVPTHFDKEAIAMVRSYYAIPEVQRRRLFDLARVLSAAA